MTVPYTFATATSAIPLSQLDSNFATAITIGNTAVYLGNTTTSFGNVTLTNVTISSVASAFPNSYLSNSTATLGNATITLGGTTTSVGNLTLTNVTISSVSTAITPAQGGTGLTSFTANGVVYASSTSALATGSALTFDGSKVALSTATSNIQLTTTVNTNQAYISLADADGRTAVFRGPNSGAPNCAQIGTTTNHETAFLYGNAEQMRLTSTGLGIGTSSVTSGSKLTIAGGNLNLTQSDSRFIGGDTVGRSIFTNSNVTTYIAMYGSSHATLPNVMSLVANGNVLTYDSAGNLGLGVTPSAWLGSRSKMEFNSAGTTAGFVGCFNGSGANNQMGLGSNCYLNASSNWIYNNSGAAGLYEILNNTHAWFNAPSGTAGNAITFTQAMTLDASGNLLVAKTTNDDTSQNGLRLTSTGSITSTMQASTNADYSYVLYSKGASTYRFYVGLGGTVYATSIVITAISDERLKENVRDIDTGLNAIMALKPRRFDWKEGKGQDKKDVAGFIAQEFETVFPECVSTSKAGEDGIEYKNINHETLIPTLVKAIQEQQALIESLTKRLAAAGI